MTGAWPAATVFGATITCLLLAMASAASVRERTLDRVTRGGGDSIDGVASRGIGTSGRIPRLAVRGICVLLGGAAGYWLAGPVGAIAGGAGTEVVRRVVAARRRGRAVATLEGQFQDMVGTLSSAVRAGLSVRRALEEAHAAAEPPLRDVLARVLDRLQTGQPLEAGIDELIDGVGSTDVSLVGALLKVHGRTGGDLPSLLDEVSLIVRQRIEARRQVRALTAQGRASGAVLAVLPIAFVGLLSGTGGDGLGAFYRSLPGGGLLLAGLVCEVGGFLWIRRIVGSTAPS